MAVMPEQFNLHPVNSRKDLRRNVLWRAMGHNVAVVEQVQIVCEPESQVQVMTAERFWSVVILLTIFVILRSTFILFVLLIRRKYQFFGNHQ